MGTITASNFGLETLTILDVYNLFGRNSNEFQFFVKKYNYNINIPTITKIVEIIFKDLISLF